MSDPTAVPRCRVIVLLARLALVAAWVATVVGALDVALNGGDMAPAEALGAVALYPLFGTIGVLLAAPFLALIWALPFIVPRRGQAAMAVAWLAVAIALLLLREMADWPLWLVVGALASFSAGTLCAWQSDRFDATAPWRIRWGTTLLLAVGLIAAPPLLRRADEVAAAAAPPRTSGRPDLVLIVLDTQRADFLGAYGHGGGLSPAFDQFARDGLLFERCYSPAPWTVPSHASLFTGMFPPSHGCSFEHHRWLDARFTTLAEALRDQGGYQTAAFVANEYLLETQLLQGFDVIEPLGQQGRRLALQPLFELLGWPARRSDHGAAHAVERIGRFLATERDGDKPLFLFVNLMEAHWRFLPALRERLAQAGDSPGVLTATDVSRRYYGPTVMAGRKLDGPLDESLRALYAAAVQYQDRALAQLLGDIDGRLGRERTLVAITADHGENLGDGGRYDHVFALNDTLLHVPLALRWPTGIAGAGAAAGSGSGGREKGLCQLVDVAPTFLEAAKIDVAAALGEECAGRSLLPDRFVAREFVLGFGDPYLGHLERLTAARGLNRDVVDLAAVLRSISDGERKLVRRLQHGVVKETLFAPANDCVELLDRSAQEADRRQKLALRLDAELAQLPAYLGPPFAPPEDPDSPDFDAEALRGIGYTQGAKR